MISNLRRQTRRICCVVAMCLLYAQLAVAAYACPKQEVPAAPAATVAAESAHSAHGCEALDAQNPNLCLQHCQGDSQLPDGVTIPIPAQSSVAMLEIGLPEPGAGSNRFIAVVRDMLLRDIAPPLTIRNCCFRI